MNAYRLKITGVHYAANPEQVAGQPDTEEMHVRTRKMLSWVRDEAPFVVLKPDPFCHHNPDAVAARVLGARSARCLSSSRPFRRCATGCARTMNRVT